MSDPLKPRHTPGPWFIARSEEEAAYWWAAGIKPECVVIGNGDRPICATNDDGIATVEDIANAQLIAAAPTMKEAIENFLTKWREVENRINDAVALQYIRTGKQYDGPTISAELDGLRKALAASEGREP